MKMPWQHRHDPDDHREHEQIVELTSVPSRFEAEILVAALTSRGIVASAVHSDHGGVTPGSIFGVGHRVMVFEGDVETARAILAENLN